VASDINIPATTRLVAALTMSNAGISAVLIFGNSGVSFLVNLLSINAFVAAGNRAFTLLFAETVILTIPLDKKLGLNRSCADPSLDKFISMSEFLI